MADTWKWTCTVCPVTGDATDLDGMEAGSRHAASHTSGPFDIVPTIHVERTQPTDSGSPDPTSQPQSGIADGAQDHGNVSQA